MKRTGYADAREVWAEERTGARHEKAVNRFLAGTDFKEAMRLASRNNLLLKRHSDTHYSLSPHGKGGWKLNIYPSNRRLYFDKKVQRPKYMQLPTEWTLHDVVTAAIGKKV